MIEFVQDFYLTIKAFHIISIITWMAGLFYLPRLYVYHSQEEVGSATSELFKVMERRLLKGIMHPSLVVVLITGGLLLLVQDLSLGWIHVKINAVIFMIACHYFYARWRIEFLEDRNKRSHKFYRVANEVPTLLMLVIVFMAVLKPF